MRSYAELVEPLIHDGTLPQLLLIGIESGTYLGNRTKDYDPELDLRAREYVPDQNDERFFLHERFFLEEVLPWAEAGFGASTEREQLSCLWSLERRGVRGYDGAATPGHFWARLSLLRGR